MRIENDDCDMKSHRKSSCVPEHRRVKARNAVALLLCLAIAAGCGPGSSLVETRQPGRSIETAQSPRPGSDGIFRIGDRRAIISQPGDTLESISARAGLTVAQLAHHNGLGTSYNPRPGEVFAVPATASRGQSVKELAAIAGSAIGRSGDSALSEEPLPALNSDEPRQTQMTATTEPAEPVQDSDRGETPPSETAATIPPARASSLSEDPQNEDEGAIEPVVPASLPARDEGEATEVSESVTETAAAPLAALSDPGTGLLMPVDGQIVRPYSSGAGGSHGVDFSAPAGTSVRASDDGAVVLVSPSETHSTIVLIRHDDNLYTVYSKITGVTLVKGDQVRRGQVVGQVASGSPPLFHYQVRRGTESVDPVPLLQGGRG